MDKFDKDIEAIKQKIYKEGYADAYEDILASVQTLTTLDGRALYKAIDNLLTHVQYVVVSGGK